MRPLGIMAAMHDEIASILDDMDAGAEKRTIGRRDYYVGQWQGRPCVVVLARIGKVAAAATAVTLIREFNVQGILFTGVAGAVAADVCVGDIVVAHELLQYDLDVRPLFPRYEVPLLGQSRFRTDPALTQVLQAAASSYIEKDFFLDVALPVRDQFQVREPRLHCGLIISGDCFVSDSHVLRELRQRLPSALCLEMEGAAVAQICYEYATPFAVLRVVSDRADDHAGVDFPAFLKNVARYYSAGILRTLLTAQPALGS